jgi:hypothetical protein
MRPALLALVLLAATGCGAASRQAQRPTADVHWPAVAEAARQQWYRGVEQAAAEPVTLTEADLEAALESAATSAGVVLVQTHYLPLLGGTEEIVVQPADPAEFANHATGITTLLGPLGRDERPYLVTVVNTRHEPLLMLGWTPHLEGSIGQGVAWQAPGIRSSAILGQPVTLEPQRRNALGVRRARRLGRGR